MSIIGIFISYWSIISGAGPGAVGGENDDGKLSYKKKYKKYMKQN